MKCTPYVLGAIHTKIPFYSEFHSIHIALCSLNNKNLKGIETQQKNIAKKIIMNFGKLNKTF